MGTIIRIAITGRTMATTGLTIGTAGTVTTVTTVTIIIIGTKREECRSRKMPVLLS